MAGRIIFVHVRRRYSACPTAALSPLSLSLAADPPPPRKLLCIRPVGERKIHRRVSIRRRRRVINAFLIVIRNTQKFMAH